MTSFCVHVKCANCNYPANCYQAAKTKLCIHVWGYRKLDVCTCGIHTRLFTLVTASKHIILHQCPLCIVTYPALSGGAAAGGFQPGTPKEPVKPRVFVEKGEQPVAPSQAKSENGTVVDKGVTDNTMDIPGAQGGG